MRKSILDKAKNAKDDEFYTQYEDIEKELLHYKEQFKGKSVYCNCDDFLVSNFWRFFHYNFSEYGLKRLIATNYSTITGEAYKAVYEGGNDYNIFTCDLQKLEGNGDFRSEECIDILKECDIVCTNPPFSLLRDFMKVLVDNDKQYLIVSARTCLSQRIIVELFINNIIKTGYNRLDNFLRPNSNYKDVCCHWFTNLDIYIPKKLELTTQYDSDKYLKYDNYDAIDVSKLKELPNDYYDIMGVPITYLLNHDHKIFEIVGMTIKNNYYFHTKKYINPKQHNKDGTITNGSKANDDAVIAYDTPPLDKTYYTADNTDKYLVGQFTRIFIKRKN